MALALVPVTRLILGPAGRPAGAAAGPLVALMALLALMFPSGAALVAVGQARFTLYANVAGLVATVGFVLLIRPDTPWHAVLVWCGAQVFVSPYSLWVNARALGVGVLRPLREGACRWPPCRWPASSRAGGRPGSVRRCARCVGDAAVARRGVRPRRRDGRSGAAVVAARGLFRRARRGAGAERSLTRQACANIARPAVGKGTDRMEPVRDSVMKRVLFSAPPYAMFVVISPAHVRI